MTFPIALTSVLTASKAILGYILILGLITLFAAAHHLARGLRYVSGLSRK